MSRRGLLDESLRSLSSTRVRSSCFELSTLTEKWILWLRDELRDELLSNGVSFRRPFMFASVVLQVFLSIESKDWTLKILYLSRISIQV